MVSIVTAPLSPYLSSHRRILLAGAGGGYDVLGAVPLLLELEAAGHEVHVGGVSFTHLPRLGAEEREPGLYAVGGEVATERQYCPEAWLAQWWSARCGERRVVWAWEKTGVRPLSMQYDRLGQALGLDLIVLVDGGIDVLLRGDETSIGTPAEDLASLAAARACSIPGRAVACVGLGAELRDGIAHAQVLERIAGLTASGGYLGSAGLVDRVAAGAAYREAVEFVFEHQQGHHMSHVHKVVLAAMSGGFGEVGPYTWLSPLLNMVWYFELDVVADSHLFLQHLAGTRTIGELTLYIEGLRKGIRVRERDAIPL